MTNDEQTALTRRVAEGLGWVQTATQHDGKPIFGDPASHDRFCEVVRLAAYAKAEMVKRGWMITPSPEPFYQSVSYGRLEDGVKAVRYDAWCHLDYDPTDPVSEAWTTLRAIDEALSLEST